MTAAKPLSLTFRKRFTALTLMVVLVGFSRKNPIETVKLQPALAQNTTTSSTNETRATPDIIEATTHPPLTTPPSLTQSPSCIDHRGSKGHWYLNESFGRETFYRFGFRSTRWYKKVYRNDTLAVYPGNSYAWNDTSLDGKCQIRPLRKKSFCELLEPLQIRRILLVGDSLMGNQLESLVSLMDYHAGDFVKVRRESIVKQHALECPNTLIPIHYRRENLGPNLRRTDLRGREDATLEHRQQFGPEIPFCVGGKGKLQPMHGDFCPWHTLYNETSDKTLLVLNQGAHFHSMNTFANSFDLFISRFNEIAHPGDILVYRATVPGHRDCFSVNESAIPVENMTHDKFLSRFATSKYDWNLFDEYNAYAKRGLAKIVPSVATHFLNVYNMTILRPDEHIAATDCLHYSLPGPVDYWNHLLFTNLADMTLELTTNSIKASVHASGEISRVEVNQRALIDKILARYASANSVYRELLQNSNDADAEEAQIHFRLDPTTKNVTEVVYRNNGMPFRDQDWSRLKKIAEGNPDVSKVGAFGVGAYTMFSICEEPLVLSGSQALAFFWKGDALWTRVGPSDHNNMEWTSFVLPSRDSYQLPDLVSFGEFLCASLTFTQKLRTVRLLVDNEERLCIRKVVLTQPRIIEPPKASSWFTSDGAVTNSSRGIFSLKSKSSIFETVYRFTVTLDRQSATNEARYVSAEARTKIPSDMARRMERVTKKKPPPLVRVEAFLNHQMHEKLPRTKAEQIVRSFAPQQGSGRIYIGFRTSQTTGLAAHLAAPFVPTVEREAMDLQDATLRVFNTELLEFGGILLRLTLDHAFGVLDEEWQQSSVEREALDKRLESESKVAKDEEAVASGSDDKDETDTKSSKSLMKFARFMARGVKKKLVSASQFVGDLMDVSNELLYPPDPCPLSSEEKRAILLMQSFCPQLSTPDPCVGTHLAEGFSRCMPNIEPPVLTRTGVVSGKQARLPHLGIEGFVKTNVVRRVIVANAEEYFAVITSTPKLGLRDLQRFLSDNILDERKASKLLQWWTKFVRADRRISSSDGIAIKDAIRFMLESGTDDDKVYAMRDFLFFLPSSSPVQSQALPIPETVIPYPFQQLVTVATFEDYALSTWFEPLPVELWVEFIGHHKCMQSGLAEYDILRLSCLDVLNKEFIRRPREERGTFGGFCRSVLSGKRCIPFDSATPNKYSADQPGNLYLQSAKLEAFEGIPHMHKVSNSLRSIDMSEDLLIELGVRKSVAIDLLFENLDTLEWSEDPRALIEYLRSATLTAEDLKKLSHTKYLPAADDSSSTYAPGELYLPSSDLHAFPFVKMLRWPSDSEIRESSPSGTFLTRLGMRSVPPLTDMLDWASDKAIDSASRLRALDFMSERLGPNGCYYKEYSGMPSRVHKSFQFLPCSVRMSIESSSEMKVLLSSVECFGEESCSCMGFAIVDPSLGDSAKMYASLFQCEPEPSTSLLIKQLLFLVERASLHAKRAEPSSRDSVISRIEESFASVFKYMSQRSSDFTKAQLQDLRTQSFIPLRSDERLLWYRPDQVFFGDSNADDAGDALTANLFPQVPFSPFLAVTGVKEEATTHDIFEKLLSDASGVAAALGSEKKYRALLRRIAANPPFARVTSRIRDAPFLIAYSMEKSPEGDEKGTFRLAKAEDVFVVDNTYFGRMFPVLRAPPEADLEDFYASLGSRYISKSVEKRFEVVGKPKAGSVTCKSLRERISERGPLLVSAGVTSRALVLDATDQIREIEVLEADSLIAVYTLEGVSKRSKTTCFSRNTSRSKNSLFIVNDFDWFDVGYALGELILRRCQLEDAFLISSLLEAPLEQLRSRGFPVDRALNIHEDAPSTTPSKPSSNLVAPTSSLAGATTRPGLSPNRGASTQAESSPSPGEILKQMFPDADERFIREKLGREPSLQDVRHLAEEMAQGDYPKHPTQDLSQHQHKNDHGKVPTEASPTKRPGRLRNKLGRAFGGLKMTTASSGKRQWRREPGGQVLSPQSQMEQAGPVAPATDAQSQYNLEQMLQQTARSTRKADERGVHSNERVLTSIPDALDRGDTCEVIPGQSLEPHSGPRGDGCSYNGIQVFAQRGDSSSKSFLDANHEAIEFFSLVLERLAGIFDIQHENLAIFYNSSGGTIAFNSNKSLHFNLRLFYSLHYLARKHDTADCYSYWLVTFCHELAHNLVSAHNKEHGYFTEAYTYLALPKLIALMSTIDEANVP